MDTIKPVISAYLGTVSTGSVGSTNSTSATTSSTTQSSQTSAQTAPSDTVQFSQAAIEVSKYASLARRIQDNVSPDKIAALKQAVATGTYPAPLVVEGLLELVGSSLSQSSTPSYSETADAN